MRRPHGWMDHGQGRMLIAAGVVIGAVKVVELCSVHSSGARPIDTMSLSTSPDSSQYSVARPPEIRHRRMWLMPARSEEHTSELQSQSNLVCRLLLEKKKKKTKHKTR